MDARRGGRSRPAEERKYLSVLSADIVASTQLIAGLDPEIALERLEPALEVMRSAVRRNGGAVSREQGDGLIALFGAPRADEHHALRACRAALDMIDGIERLKDDAIRVRVGVHSGEVVAHFVEDDFSSIYEAAGPVVHTVERLQSSARPGQIFASATCRLLCEGAVKFGPVALLSLKGFVEPIGACQVIGIGDLSRWDARSSRPLSPFVGRAIEIAKLQRFAESAVERAGTVVSIVGEPGTGKSRLAREFAEKLQKSGWRVIAAECDPMSQGIPQSLVKNLLRNAGVADGLAQSCRPTGPDQLDPPDSGLVRAALSSIFDHPIDNPRWSKLEDVQRRRITLEASRSALLNATKNRPTVILIEDIQWMDRESAFIVEHVLSSFAGRQPVLIVLTGRNDGSPAFRMGREIKRLNLKPLDIDDARLLLERLIGVSISLEALKNKVLHQTGGVPLFIEEVVRQLAETGTLIGERGAFSPACSTESLDVPATIQGVIASRIDRLSVGAKFLLQIASAIGPCASPRLLGIVAQLPEAAVRSRLVPLAMADMLTEVGDAQDTEYQFPHDLIREVAYGSMLKPHRRVLHLRILGGLESLAGDAPLEIAETLAHHARQANEWAKLETYGHLAARKCLRRSAFPDAARYFEWSIDAIERSEATQDRDRRAVDIRLEARRAFSSTGNNKRWAELAREAETRAIVLGDGHRQVAAAAAHASALVFCSTPPEAIAASEGAVKRAKEIGAGGWQSFAEICLAQAYCMAGRYRHALDVVRCAYPKLSTEHHELPIGTTRASLQLLYGTVATVAHVALGDPDEAELYERQVNELSIMENRIYDKMVASFGRAHVRLFRADLACARGVIDEAITTALRYDVRQFLPLFYCQLANLALRERNIAAARLASRNALDEAEAQQYTTSRFVAANYLALTTHQDGDSETGLGIARATIDACRQQGFRWHEAQAQIIEGTVLMAGGAEERQDARRSLAMARDIARELNTKPQIGEATQLLAQLCVLEGDTQSARREFDGAIDLFAAMKMLRQLESVKRARSGLID